MMNYISTNLNKISTFTGTQKNESSSLIVRKFAELRNSLPALSLLPVVYAGLPDDKDPQSKQDPQNTNQNSLNAALEAQGIKHEATANASEVEANKQLAQRLLWQKLSDLNADLATKQGAFGAKGENKYTEGLEGQRNENVR